MTRILGINLLLITFVLLAVLFDNTFACGRKNNHHHRIHHYGKRSIENSNSDETTSDYTIEDSDERPERTSCFRSYNSKMMLRKKAEEENERKARKFRDSLPVPDTSCGKILCTDSPNYPTDAIAEIVGEARKMLEFGNRTAEFKNKAITLKSFESKVHDKTMFFRSEKCLSGAITYPLEGYNRWKREYFYVVNIPGFSQGVCTSVCDGSNEDYYQGYTEENLVVLPIGQHEFKIQDLKIRNIVVPHDCSRGHL